MLIPLKDTWGYLGILALDLGFRGASGTADDLESSLSIDKKGCLKTLKELRLKFGGRSRYQDIRSIHNWSCKLIESFGTNSQSLQGFLEVVKNRLLAACDDLHWSETTLRSSVWDGYNPRRKRSQQDVDWLLYVQIGVNWSNFYIGMISFLDYILNFIFISSSALDHSFHPDLSTLSFFVWG